MIKYSVGNTNETKHKCGGCDSVFFFSFNEQQRQKERLKELSEKLNKERDILENRHSHAKLLLQSMENSVAENTFV